MSGTVYLTRAGHVVTVRRSSALPGYVLVDWAHGGVILSQCLRLADLTPLTRASDEVKP